MQIYEYFIDYNKWQQESQDTLDLYLREFMEAGGPDKYNDPKMSQQHMSKNTTAFILQYPLTSIVITQIT